MRTGAMRSTIGPNESPARDHVFPAGRRRRSAAAPQVRDTAPRPRDRDARAGAGRSEVDLLGSGSPAADPGLDPPRPLPWATRPQARRRAARSQRARPALPAGQIALAAGAPSRPERPLET